MTTLEKTLSVVVVALGFGLITSASSSHQPVATPLPVVQTSPVATVQPTEQPGSSLLMGWDAGMMAGYKLQTGVIQLKDINLPNGKDDNVALTEHGFYAGITLACAEGHLGSRCVDAKDYATHYGLSYTIAPLPSIVATPSTTPVTASCGSGTYINSDGNCIPVPTHSSTVPIGASAQCSDGSYSYSQHRQGTCSHHGGVAVWY